jgi:penicillin-binding protein 1A
MKKDTKRIILNVLKVGGLAALLAAAALTVAVAVLLAVYSGSLPSTEDLRENYNPPQINRFYAADGSTIGETYAERRTIVQISKVPRFVVNAILSAEDADFFKHEGLDYPGILRALVVDVLKGERSQGASTITQQVARTFYLGREKTFKRKMKELLLARRIEQNLSKQEILFLYINQIYWGHGRYGIQEASIYYTGKEVADLTLGEAALLAGLPRGPEIYSPFKNPKKAAARRSWVLQQMVQHGTISEKEALSAQQEPVPDRPHAADSAGAGAEFIDAATKLLVKVVGKEKVAAGGYKVWTTMEPQQQKAAREALAIGLKQIDRRRGYIGPLGYKKTKKGLKEEKCPWHPPGEGLKPAQNPALGKIYEAAVLEGDDATGKLLVQAGGEKGVVNLEVDGRYNPASLKAGSFARPGCSVRVSLLSGRETYKGKETARFRLEMGPQGAFVAIDVSSSKVTAMVGGYDYRQGDFNRVTMARRQPGSAFKTFVYLTALKNRKITPAVMLEDTPLLYEDYQPKNYETWHFEGKVRLRRALAESINLVAVRVAELAGIGEVVKLARKMGIDSALEPNLALALGASGVTPLELANAYTTIARGGIRWEPIIVTKIAGPDGKEIELPPPSPPERVLSAEEAFIIANMLESVVKEGTAVEALGLKRPCAGKTGTSNSARDAWFVGFVPTLTAAVWVGFDDYKPLGKNETGSRAALPIWLRFMKKAVKNMPVGRFGLPPEGIVIRSIDPATGLLAWEGQPDAITEVFLKGTEPTGTAPRPIPTTEILIEEAGGAAAPPPGGDAAPRPAPDAGSP